MLDQYRKEVVLEFPYSSLTTDPVAHKLTVITTLRWSFGVLPQSKWKLR